MNSFTLLYLFYSAKLGSQASIYFIWLKDSSSRTIAFIAAAVAVFAIFPLFHVIVHVFSAKPLSNSTFIAYICFSLLLAILWYEPTRDGEQGVLPFALVTTVDLLALFIFLFQRQIGHWHDILTSDIEQGHPRAGSIDDASVTLVGRGNEQVEHRDFGGRTDTRHSEIYQIQVMQEPNYDIDAINRSGRDVGSSTGINTVRWNPRSVIDQPGGPAAGGFDQRLDGRETSGGVTGAEAAMRSPSNIGWGTEMVQSVSEGQAGRADLELGQQQRSGFFIDRGIDSDSEFEATYPPCPVGTPNTIYSDMHPALRPTFGNTPLPVTPDGSQTPKEAPSPLGTKRLEQNQI